MSMVRSSGRAKVLCRHVTLTSARLRPGSSIFFHAILTLHFWTFGVFNFSKCVKVFINEYQ